MISALLTVVDWFQEMKNTKTRWNTTTMVVSERYGMGGVDEAELEGVDVAVGERTRVPRILDLRWSIIRTLPSPSDWLRGTLMDGMKGRER